MLAVLGIVSAGILILVSEGRMLWKQKKRKEMIVFSLSLVLALSLYITMVLDVPIPSISSLIGQYLEPAVKPIVRWTKGGAS
jgi:hypothetical protein